MHRSSHQASAAAAPQRVPSPTVRPGLGLTRAAQLLRGQALGPRQGRGAALRLLGLQQGRRAALRLLGLVLLQGLGLLRSSQRQRQAPRHLQSAPLVRSSTAQWQPLLRQSCRQRSRGPASGQLGHT